MPAAPEPPPVRVGAILAQVGFVVVAALLVYGFVAVTKDGELRRVCSAPSYLRPDYLGADRRAPDFTLKDLRGAEVSLASLRGKVVVLNFWTKTCGPCLEEMPGSSPSWRSSSATGPTWWWSPSPPTPARKT